MASSSLFRVIVVGVTTNINMTELAVMASGDDMTNVFTVNDFNALLSVIGGAIVVSSGDFCKHSINQAFYL